MHGTANSERLEQRLTNGRVVSVLRTASADVAIGRGRSAVAAGVDVIEVTMTVPDARRVISELTGEFPDVAVGAGTVVSAELAREAARAGASFLVSPHLDEVVLREALKLGLPMIPGAATPGEVWRASVATGGGVVKVFPVAQLGGPAYVRSLLGPYPDLKLMTNGGVTLEDAASYLDAGAAAVGLTAEIAGEGAARAVAELRGR